MELEPPIKASFKFCSARNNKGVRTVIDLESVESEREPSPKSYRIPKISVGKRIHVIKQLCKKKAKCLFKKNSNVRKQ